MQPSGDLSGREDHLAGREALGGLPARQAPFEAEENREVPLPLWFYLRRAWSIISRTSVAAPSSCVITESANVSDSGMTS
jgi:hypothetical protein